ncbi:hypothetical protein [Methanocella conradii]|uniref:hypothetical protein n=1 Tax=Methanocella conradii TaxID=1175444 RepID=UPI00157C4208|nr:hypothetical protein [Methanocella conradii]
MSKIRLKTITISLLLTCVTFGMACFQAYAWDGDTTHKDMAYWAGATKGVEAEYLPFLRDAGPAPDSFDQPYCQIRHAYLIDTGWPNEAPRWCQDHANDAKLHYGQGQKLDAYKELGYATHYIIDVSNLMHTTIRATDTPWWNPLRFLHDIYEVDYVKNNWNSGKNFGQYTYTYGTQRTIGIYDPYQACVDMARYANGDSSTRANYICDKIIATSDYGNDNTVVFYTKDNLVNAMAYCRGLVDYIRRP